MPISASLQYNKSEVFYNKQNKREKEKHKIRNSGLIG